MRQIGAAVVPAVARAVIDAPCAPGQAAVGRSDGSDRRIAARRRPPPRHAANDDDPGAGVAPQCLLRPARAAPVARRPRRACAAPPAPGSAVVAPPPLCCVAMTGAPVIGSFGAPRRAVCIPRRLQRSAGAVP
jgi:hypothetical protein